MAASPSGWTLNMIKVLHVVNYGLPYVDGYAMRSHYVAKFQKMCLPLCPVVFCSPFRGYATHREVEDIKSGDIPGEVRYVRSNYKVPLLRRDRITRRLASVSTEWRLWYLLGRVLKDERPDVVHAHHPFHIGLAAWMQAKQSSLPFVYELRCFNEEYWMPEFGWRFVLSHRLRRMGETTALKLADAVVTIGSRLQSEIIARGVDPERIFVIPNGVDTREFQPCGKDAALRDRYGLQGKTVVGYIGTLSEPEGLDLVIRAMGVLRKSHPNLRCLLVGGGAYLLNLIQARREFGVRDRVIFTGFASRTQLRSYYSLIDVFVMPRRSYRVNEITPPLKPLEAMAMKIPVLASRVGGLKELIPEDKAGLFFQPGNLDDLAAKLALLADRPELRDRLAHEGRKYVEQCRDWRGLINSYEEVYESAKENKMRRRQRNG